MKVRCCIVGGGPAGMMLGYLLGRAGIDVVVLEKHADFFRDFRGDTVHPSTLQVMHELGLIDGFLKLPHERLQKMDGMFGGASVRLADLSRLDANYPFTGFSDHGVSEALYLNDPDQNGVELYWDKPRDQWPVDKDGNIEMYTRHLDLDSLLSELNT